MEMGQIDWKAESSPRERIYFGVILLLLIIAFSRWFYIPKLQKISKANAEVVNLNLQVDMLKKFVQLQIPVAPVKSSDAFAKPSARLEQLLKMSKQSEKQDIADVVRFLSNRSALSGASLKGFSIGAEANKDSYRVVPVSIEVEGKYSVILAYLNHIEKLGKLVTADNVELNVKEHSPSVVSAKVGASIYLVGPGAAPQPQSAAESNETPAQPATDASAGMPGGMEGK